jgi:hypothetical protein
MSVYHHTAFSVLTSAVCLQPITNRTYWCKYDICMCEYPLHVGHKKRTRWQGVLEKLINICINAFVYRLASDKPDTAGTYVGVP